MMKNSKIVIGNGIEDLKDDKKEKELRSKEASPATLSAAPNAAPEMIQEPVYENDWGNENSVLNKLKGKLLADRRLYARALYMQRVKCNTLFDNLEYEPSRLTEPMEFMIIDLSVGGIGIICEHEIMVGTILSFKLSLDHIEYNVKCEVVYCFQNSDKYRAGLRIVDRDRNFIRHLKIFVARLTLQSKYGSRT